jgi:hypothetical protein
VYLTDVQLVPDWPGDFRENNKLYRLSAGHVEDVFRCHLPRRFTLNGAQKVVIHIGGHRETREYESLGIYRALYPDYSRATFDAESAVEREEHALAIIEATLTRLAASDSEPIRVAAAATRRLGFRYQTLLKTSKWHVSRRWRAEVVLSIRRGGSDLQLRLRSRSGELVRTVSVLEGSWSHPIYHATRRSRWVGSTFELYDSAGRVSASLSLPE